MEKTFALDRVSMAMTLIFFVGLWLPLGVLGGLDALGRPESDGARGFLFAISAVGLSGMAWTIRFLRARVIVTGDRLVSRTAFGSREIALGSVARLWRKTTRVYRSRTDQLTLGFDGAPPLVIDLLLLHDAEGLVALIRQKTRLPLSKGL